MKSNNFGKYLLILLITPGIISVLVNPLSVLREWVRIPEFVNSKTSSIINEDRIEKIGYLRWVDKDSGSFRFYAVKLFYNKGIIVVDEFFDYVSFYSPRIYFQAGDGTKYSPQNVEPVPFILFPFWLVGLTNLFTRKRWKLLVGLLATGVLAYLTGQKNMAFLFPILMIYTFISYESLFNMHKEIFNRLIFLYSLFLLIRMIII